MAKRVPHPAHKRAHIKRKEGVYYYRRRLPSSATKELTVSLRTRNYRLAVHLTGALDGVFDEAWSRAVAATTDETQLRTALRDSLAKWLDDDVRRRSHRKAGNAAYAYWWDLDSPEGLSRMEADLKEIRAEQSTLRYYLANGGAPFEFGEAADELLASYGLPPGLRKRLILGLTETRLRAWEEIERRTLFLSPWRDHAVVRGRR